MTGPQLFAIARGIELNDGCHRCFYCMAPCDSQFTSRQYVKDSFTGRDTVAGGDVVCRGCVEALQEKTTVRLADGKIRDGQKIRCYSWVFNRDVAIAATKAHRDWLLGKCLDPISPPFVICLSDNGQKHLLYRSVVNYSPQLITVTLEAEHITYCPCDLVARVELTKRIAAALGQPALGEYPTPSAQMRVVEHYQDESLLSDWLKVHSNPLTRLAAWFTPSKKELVHVFARVTR